MLGHFDEDEHKKWIKEHPQKLVHKDKSSKQLNHFYPGGALCDITGEKRQTEVQLKCPENASSLTKVSIYLMEPRTCQYILNVETALICDVIDKIDEHGLVPSIADLTAKSTESHLNRQKIENADDNENIINNNNN